MQLKMRNVYWLILSLFSYNLGLAQEIPPLLEPKTEFTLLQKIGELGDATVGNLPLYSFSAPHLTADGDLLVTNIYGSSFPEGLQVLRSTNLEGITRNLYTPFFARIPCEVPNCTYGQAKTAYFSPDGKQIVYADYRYRFSSNGGIAFYRLISGSPEPVLILDLVEQLGNRIGRFGFSVNNFGASAVYLENLDTGINEIFLIDSLGFKKSLLVSPRKLKAHAALAINGKGTVFYAADDGGVFAIPMNGVATAIGTTSVDFVNSQGSFVAPEIYTTANPEGVLFYSKTRTEIVSSDGSTRVNAGNQSTTIDYFAVNDSGTILWSGVDYRTNQSVLYKGLQLPENRVLAAGDLVNGEIISGVTSPAINNNGDIAVFAYGPRVGFELPKARILRSGLPKLCKVADKGRNVTWESQTSFPWGRTQLANLPDLPKKSRKMSAKGCTVTSFSMLLKSYGILKTWDGKNVDPGTLNQALANYTPVKSSKLKSFAFTNDGDLLMPRAAEVGKESYVRQCVDAGNPRPTCDSQKHEKISYINREVDSKTEAQLLKEIEEQICMGNPVITRLRTQKDGAHYVLATGFAIDAGSNKKTLVFQDPGRAAEVDGKDARLSQRTNLYSGVSGYRLFKQTRDPAMISVVATDNVHLVVMDPAGKKTGFDSVNNIKYNDNELARYDFEALSSVNEDPLSEVEILYSHNTFEQTSGVVDGNYEVQLHGVTSGPYTVTVDRQDRNGYYNGEDVFEGIIAAGQTIKLQFAHSEEPALPDEPSPTQVELKVNSLIYSDLNSGKAIKPMMLFSGSIELGTKDLVLTKPVEIKVGQNNPYIRVINPTQFRVRKIGKSREYYITLSKEESIVIFSDGKFRIILRDPKLAILTDDQKQYVSLKIEDRVGSKKVILKCNKMICMMK